jgi:hypothetical protein
MKLMDLRYHITVKNKAPATLFSSMDLAIKYNLFSSLAIFLYLLNQNLYYAKGLPEIFEGSIEADSPKTRRKEKTYFACRKSIEDCKGGV